MIERKQFCDQDCNNCQLPNNRQLTYLLNALYQKFGAGVYSITQFLCPNLTCCADCHVDDFCHFENCELEKAAKNLIKQCQGEL